MSADNKGLKLVTWLGIGLGVAAIYTVFKITSNSDEKQVNGLPKSPQASGVLKLMDKDESYGDALKSVVNEYTKGQSKNSKKRFKRQLEKELNNYI